MHRDVKPGNVLITTAGQVKVTDFGIARAGGANDGLTRTGAVMGTATYFSPEQAQGLPVDGRSDVYSLGVVLYEMATGQPPFTGDSPVSTAYKHVREPIVLPSKLVPSIPPELERVIVTCLMKEPVDRYQSADDLRTDLLRFRRGQAVVGMPITAAVTTIPDSTMVAAAVPGPPTTVAPIPVTDTTLPPKKKSKGPIIAVIVLLIALIGVIAYLLITQLGDDSSGASIEVADVVNQPVGPARALLEAQGLEVTVQRRPNDQVEKGLVVRQDPAAGTKVGDGENVVLTVSDGAGSVKVPDVEGMTFEEAQAALEARGLNAARQDEASDSVPLGEVTRTEPARGRDRRPGQRRPGVRLGWSRPGQRAQRRGSGPGRRRADPDRRGVQVREGEPVEWLRAGGHGHRHEPRGRYPGAARQRRHDERLDRSRAGRGPGRGRPDSGGCHRDADQRGPRRPGRAGPVVGCEHRTGDHPESVGRQRGQPGLAGHDHGRHRPGRDDDHHHVTRAAALAGWYAEHGRHDLAWRATRDRWPILVSEVMLQQTQVPRVAEAWPGFIGRFPTAAAMASAGPGAVITAWGRLGYPRRARRLWEAATVITTDGWPEDLTALPGVGRYTAGAILAQADDADVPAVEVNIRRVVERCAGSALSERDAEAAMVKLARPLRGRDRLLALMDVGALLCKPRAPRCGECPLRRRCATRGERTDETRSRQPAFAGSFRQRRGLVMARLRAGTAVAIDELDAEALASLVADGLAVVRGQRAALP